MNDSPVPSIDPRILNLSYSSLGTLHSCPRKFQLYRLGSEAADTDGDGTQNLTFAFGHVVGDGIAAVFQGLSYERIILRMFLGWHADIMDENRKQNKSFWVAMSAVQRLIHMRDNGFLGDYDLVYYNGTPAIELGFRISFPDGFRFRGFVDVVLRHRHTGAVLVLECKTSSAASLNPATFKNSSQAIGYSVVLDVLFPELSSYEVLYLVFLTKAMEYEILTFTKSYLQRALWIQELLLDIDTIKMYAGVQVYPMRGESCYSFFRECEYLNVCTLSTHHLVKPYDATAAKAEEFAIELTLADLINAQISKHDTQTEVMVPKGTAPNSAQLGDTVL